MREISAIKRQAVKTDEPTKLFIDKVRTTRELVKVAQNKKKDIIRSTEAAKSIVADAYLEADRMIKDARQKAEQILSTAKSEKSLVEKCQEQNRLDSDRLNELKIKLEAQEGHLERKSVVLDNQAESLKNKTARSEEMFAEAQKAKDDATELFGMTVTVFDLVMELATKIETLRSKTKIEISQTFENTKILLAEVSTSLTKIEAEKKYVVTERQNLETDRKVLDSQIQEVQQVAERSRKNGA